MPSRQSLMTEMKKVKKLEIVLCVTGPRVEIWSPVGKKSNFAEEM